MVAIKFFAIVTAAAGLAAAAPAAEEAQIQYFKLKTKVISGDSSKNNLYVQSYHTGAGLGDATLAPGAANGAKAYFNGTNLQFVLGQYPSGLDNSLTEQYTEWLPSQINAGYGTGHFFYNSSGVQSSDPSWEGWLACDWNHGVPQLFWQYYTKTPKLPSSCAKVELLKA